MARSLSPTGDVSRQTSSTHAAPLLLLAREETGDAVLLLWRYGTDDVYQPLLAVP